MKATLFPADKTGEIIEFDAVPDESLEASNQITSLPLEDGTTMTDHVIINPDSFSFSGVIVDGLTPAETKRAKLMEYRNNATILIYKGRQRIERVVINSLRFSTSVAIFNGYAVEISLQAVKLTAFETENIPGPDPTVEDAERILRVIVGLEPPLPGERVNASDAVRVLQDIVRAKTQTRQLQDIGQQALHPAGWVRVSRAQLPYTCRINVDGGVFDLTIYYDRDNDSYSVDFNFTHTRGGGNRTAEGVKIVYGRVIHEWSFIGRVTDQERIQRIIVKNAEPLPGEPDDYTIADAIAAANGATMTRRLVVKNIDDTEKLPGWDDFGRGGVNIYIEYDKPEA